MRHFVRYHTVTVTSIQCNYVLEDLKLNILHERFRYIHIVHEGRL
jgi:hypothetical protein